MKTQNRIDHPDRADSPGQRRAECGKPDHIDGNMRKTAMHEGIADKRKNHRRINKAARHRKARRDQRKVHHELKILPLAQNIILIDIDRDTQPDQSNHDTRNIEDRLAAACAAHFRLGNAHEVLLSLVFRKHRQAPLTVRLPCASHMLIG